MWIVIAGDFMEGIQEIRGPFETPEEAEEYADTHNMGHHPKGVFEVTPSKECAADCDCRK